MLPSGATRIPLRPKRIERPTGKDYGICPCSSDKWAQRLKSDASTLSIVSIFHARLLDGGQTVVWAGVSSLPFP